MSQKSSGDQARALLDSLSSIFKVANSDIRETPHQAVKEALAAGFYNAVLTAITTFQQSSPDKITPELSGRLGYTLNELGRHAEAEGALRTAIKLDPDYAAAHSNLGYTLNELGRYAEGVGALQTAIKLDPDYAVAHNNLGYALNELGRYDEAEGALRTAIKLDPDDAVAHNNLGCVLNKLGRYDEAEEACQTAIKLYPTLPHPHWILAEISLHRDPDNTDEALSHLKDAFDRAGKYTKRPFLFNLYESTIAASSSPDEAQKTLRQWSTAPV